MANRGQEGGMIFMVCCRYLVGKVHELTTLLVSLDTLDAQQLTAVKKQLDEEVEHLTSSYAQLGAAQSKFKECVRVVKAGSATLQGR
jgi:hypothetical protein